ncbi:hypothetical protein LEP1GSC090_3493 [Leptospira borgpetersenii serovar Javanica str. MK146]|nr:hypothetical protein LEP1GSC090_3493 [Leptospira borgpetersenii serovar Javanica str. MK146]
MTLEETQRLASIGARRNSASRFYWRSTDLGQALDIRTKSSLYFLVFHLSPMTFTNL